MNRTTLVCLTLTAALTVSTALGQSMSHTDSMSMSGVPMLHFTTTAGMNMMMGKGGDLMIMAAPGMGRYTYTMSGHRATLTFASRDAKGLFAYYDKAIRAEGWKEDMSMAMGMMGAGQYGERYMMGKHTLDLSSVTTGAKTTVTFKVR